MARPLRIEIPGGCYHVTARGNERRNIFRDEADRRHFVELLAELPEPRSNGVTSPYLTIADGWRKRAHGSTFAD